ncbi:MAG: PAS domain-containing sensor histidine kinase [Clostridia bacterium]|nr:PAS domain-containing sensor histidine kinase [Clostridia bacterium]
MTNPCNKQANNKSFTFNNISAKTSCLCKYLRLNRDLFKTKILSFKITFIYALVGGLWILLSDKLLAIIASNTSTITYLQTLKGWFFVIGTSCMLYLLIRNSLKRIEQSEKELKAKEELYRMVITSTTDGLWDWDIKNNSCYLSPQFKSLLGYEEDELSNSLGLWNKLVYPDDRQMVIDIAYDCFKRHVPQYKTEYRIVAKDGKTIWVLSQGQIIFDDNFKPIRMVGTYTNITERKNTEKSLNKTMEKNKELLNEVIEYDKLKTEFFANISHEFRTPLNVILGTIQLMEVHKKNCLTDNTCSYKMPKFINMMKQNCYRLLRLINNLIDITRIDSGFLQINLKNYNIVDVVERVTLSVTEFASNKSVDLIFDTDVEDKTVACDADKIERVILNLLSNALKYTKPGGSIFVSIFDKDDRIVISVKDTGTGIPQDKLDLIFERFRQVNSSLTRDNEGSGIGLSLVKSLVEMHGGKIWVESQYGSGSEFFIELPVTELSEESNKPLTAEIKDERVERVKIEFSDIYFEN